MRRHAGDVDAESRPEIVIRSLPLPVGFEISSAIIPVEEALEFLICDERAVGLVEYCKALVASDLEQVVHIRIVVVIMVVIRWGEAIRMFARPTRTSSAISGPTSRMMVVKRLRKNGPAIES